MDFNKQKLSEWCTELADSFVYSGFHKYSRYFIALFIIVSASTEVAFLYMDTIQPLVNNEAISIIITLVFVAAIEGLNYFGLKSSLVAGKINGWFSFLIIFVFIYATAKIVSLSISVGGAMAAVEIKSVEPYQVTHTYKDSIANYYQNRIEEGNNSPREANAANITTLKEMSTSILAEIENIRNDKGNYTHDGIFFVKAQAIVKKKEESLKEIRESISKIMLNDKGVINAKSENNKLRTELDKKLKDIAKARKKYLEGLNDKNIQAFWIILFVEFFSFVLNLMRTFTGIYKTPSKEDDLKAQEIEWALDDKRQRIILRMENAIIKKAIQNRITENAACTEIGKLRGNSSINKKTFQQMRKEYANGRSRADINGIEQDSTK